MDVIGVSASNPEDGMLLFGCADYCRDLRASWTYLHFSTGALAGVAVFTPIIPTIAGAFSSHSSSASIPSGDAPMFGFDAQNTRNNTAEHILTYTDVPHLVPDWTSPATRGSIFSSPVVANGVVYVGSFDGRLYAFDAASCGKPTCPHCGLRFLLETVSFLRQPLSTALSISARLTTNCMPSMPMARALSTLARLTTNSMHFTCLG